MRHSIKITQTIVTQIDIDAVDEEEALKIGNKILEKERIPLEKYEMIEALVQVDKKIQNSEYDLRDLSFATTIQ